MISKFFLRKIGFGKSKTENHVVNKNCSPTSGKEVEAKPPLADGLNGRQSSSKFDADAEVASPESLLGDASVVPSNSVSPVVSETCCSNDDSVSSSDAGDADLSDVVSEKPKLRPKTKIPSLLQLTLMPTPEVISGGTSPYVTEAPSPPVQLKRCRRDTIFPPPCPPSPKQENDQKDRLEPSSEVAQMRDIIREPTIRRMPGLNVPTTNRGSRSSRRSFTTDDADIGLYKKPSFCPELPSLPDPSRPRSPAGSLRRGNGSDVGRRIHMYEQLAVASSGSFSKERPAVRQARQESQTVTAKPKPLVKPRISEWNRHLEKVSTSNSLPELNKNFSPVTEEETLTSAGSYFSLSSNENPQLSTNKPAESNASNNLPNPELEKNDVLNQDEIYNRETDSFSANDSSDESDENESGDECQEQNSFENHSDEDAKELPPVDKAKKVAEELLKTEEAYVSRLRLLDEEFHMGILDQNRQEHFIPEDVIPQIFSSIKSILLFHNDFLLPQLHSCMAEWDSCIPRIGLVLKKFAPFLKLYTDYVKNFENATNLITLWIQRSPRFATFLDELQRRPECGSLTLQHHLLEPIQRVPRYELLLRDYIKHLPEDSEDRIHASEALELVTCAAQHSNMEMRKIEKFRKLLDLNDALGGSIDLVKPTRELIKEGKITKISARDGDHSERYLFLFNDLLVVCQSVTLKQLGLRQQQYVVKSELDIRGMQVLEGNNLETANTFVIKSKQKSIEFYGGTQELKEEWQRALWSAISDFTKKEHTRNADPNLLAEFQERELGKRAPTWVKDQETTMCMVCGERFTTFKRRHHCRCCGKVVCSTCSAYKAKLAYSEARELRVCVNCSTALGLQQAKVSAEKGALNKARAVLKTSAADPSVISGYLNVSRNRKNWNRKFFALHSNFVLYTFKAHQDVIARSSLPLPGYEISNVEKSEEVQMRDFVFCISKKELEKFYYFQADDESQRKRWIDILLCAIIAELPSKTISFSTPKVEITSDGASSPPSDDIDSSTTTTHEPTCDGIMEPEEESP